MMDTASWQQAIESVSGSFDSLGPATDLYIGCLRLLLRLTKCQTQACHATVILRLRIEAQSFSLWGASFNALEGSLDHRVAKVDRLRNAFLPLLSEMGESIFTLCHQMKKEDEFWGHLLPPQISFIRSRSDKKQAQRKRG